MTAKKINHAAISKKIATIPGVCADGKKAIGKILKELGYIPPPVREPKVGEVWYFRDEDEDDGAEDEYWALIAHKVGVEYYIVPLGTRSETNLLTCYISNLTIMREQHKTLEIAFPNILEYAKRMCP